MERLAELAHTAADMELLAEARRESEQIAAGAEQLAETRCRLVERARTAAYAEPLAETNWRLAE